MKSIFHNMPKNWTVKKISDVFFFQEGPGVRKWQFREKGIKLLNGSNINNGTLELSNTKIHLDEAEANGKYKHFLVNDGDLVIASSGVVVDNFHNKIAFVKKEHLPLCMNTSTIRFQVLDEKSASLDFLKYFLKTNLFKTQIGKLITGSAQLNFGPSHLQKIQIPLPPLADQVRIAAVLTRAEKLIARRKESIKALDELLKSTFLEMFGDIMARKSIHPWEKLRPYLTAQSGKSSKGVLSAIKTDFPIYGGNGINGWATKPLFLQSVVIAGRVGQQCGVIYVSKGPCWVTDNAIVLRIKDNTKLNSIYLTYAFTYSPILEKVKQLDLPFINQPMLLDIKIPMPKIASQIKFAAIVEKVESLKARSAESLAELENLYGALSQRVFKGELDLSRVPAEIK